jgi:hypothetical protein
MIHFKGENNMSEKELDQLDEFKADGENSMAADAVTGAGGSVKKRMADKATAAEKADNIEDDVKTPQGTAGKVAPKRTADRGMKESVEEMFAGSDLSEDFKEKATVVFEAAVHVKLTEEVARLEEEFEAKLDEQVDIVVSELTEKVDTYLDYVVENWMEENKVAIDRGIRAEIAESFINGLRDLFVEHNINVPEDEINVVADMAEQLEATENQLNDAINEAIELRAQLEDSTVEKMVESYSKGLTETQAEKLYTLAEGIEFSDVEEFEKKLKIVKESYFDSKSVLSEGLDYLDPIEDAQTSMIKHDPSVSAYVDAISRSLRK